MAFFRARKGDAESLTAAAFTTGVIDMNTISALKSVRSHAIAGLKRGWTWYDGIGEVHYAVNRCGNIASRTVFRMHALRPDGTVGDVVEDPRVVAAVDGIWSPHGGLPGLIKQFELLLKIPAHAHLIHLRDETGDRAGLQFCSDDEIEFRTEERDSVGAIWRKMLPGVSAGIGTSTAADPLWERVRNEDYIGHVWTPHPRWTALPDPPMGALDTICEELDVMTKGILGKLNSRLLMAGVWYIPSEVSEIVGSNERDGGPVFSNDKVINAFVKAGLKNRTDVTNASGWFPILMRGPGEQSTNLRWIVPEMDITDSDLRLRGEATQRILRGLDVVPEGTTGYDDQNHMNAWASRDDEITSVIKPDMDIFAWVVRSGYIDPALRDAGLSQAEIDGMVFVADTSGCATRPNAAEDARQASDRGALSFDGIRKTAGLDQYAPSEVDQIRSIGWKTGNPVLFLHGVKTKIDWEQVAKFAGAGSPGPDPTTNGDPAPASHGTGADGSPGKSQSDKPKSQRPGA